MLYSFPADLYPARRTEIEERLKEERDANVRLQHQEQVREAPQASTSAFRLDEDGFEEQNGKFVAVKPARPWGLREYGIPQLSASIEPDPLVTVSLTVVHPEATS